MSALLSRLHLACKSDIQDWAALLELEILHIIPATTLEVNVIVSAGATNLQRLILVEHNGVVRVNAGGHGFEIVQIHRGG